MSAAVRQDSSCLRGFLWNIDHGLSCEAVVARLRDAGWDGQCFAEVLWTFRRGHDKVVYVPSNGRLQVRVDMTTPFESRRNVAEAVWASLQQEPTEAPLC